jgi:hypothetical protein
MQIERAPEFSYSGGWRPKCISWCFEVSNLLSRYKHTAKVGLQISPVYPLSLAQNRDELLHI